MGSPIKRSLDSIPMKVKRNSFAQKFADLRALKKNDLSCVGDRQCQLEVKPKSFGINLIRSDVELARRLARS